MWIQVNNDCLNTDHITHFEINEHGDSVIEFSSGVRLTRESTDLVFALLAVLPMCNAPTPAPTAATVSKLKAAA